MVGRVRCSAQDWRCSRWRTGATGRATLNGDVWELAGVMAGVCTHGEGKAWCVRDGRLWRSGVLSAWHRESGRGGFLVVHGLPAIECWIGGGGGQWPASQTCWLGLLLILACCRHGGDMGVLGYSPLMAMPSLQWG